MGSIFRTADAAGVAKIYCCGITPTPLDRFKEVRADFAKVSLGAERSVAWEYLKATAQAVEAARAEGCASFAVEQSKKSVPYSKALKITARGGRGTRSKEKKICLIMGNEVDGVPPGILKLADRVLEIPMRGKKESLNVAVAFGIVAFGLLQ